MDYILIFTLKWWLSDKKLRMNPPPKNTRKSKNQDSISIFSFHSFTFWSAPDKKMSTELGAGGGWGLQRQREGLLMTVMTETLESNEQCECWVCHSASSGSVSATRKRALQKKSHRPFGLPWFEIKHTYPPSVVQRCGVGEHAVSYTV